MTNICMSIVANISAVLLLPFRTLYGISFSLLGLLLLLNFVTQLSVDLIFSFFSHKFNIEKTVKFTPLLTMLGLLVYAVWPALFPHAAYPGLVIGTVIFAAAGGLGEVLISPVIAAIPAEEPEREISKLHSVYAWGVVLVIAISTVFLHIFGVESWQKLILLLLSFPLLAVLFFGGTKLPKMETPEKVSGALSLLKNRGLWLCILAIFLGGAAECTMGQWASGYLEGALGIPKVWGDLFGVALFSVTLGLGRSLYGKYGKNPGKILFLGSIGAALCYFVCAVISVPFLALLACAATGLCVSMLWPGSLIVASDRFPSGGVFVFAMMAAGGDSGASFGPQLVGIITDAALKNPTLLRLADHLQLMPQELGLKLGMLLGMLFPLLAAPVYFRIWKKERE